jgi:hypothetical protein
MKKLVTILMVLFAIACTKQPAPEAGSTGSTEVSTFEVPGTTDTKGSVTLSFGFLQSRINTRNAGDWSGSIEVSGEGISGTYTAFLFRDDIANGKVKLILPLGQKDVKLSMQYERTDGQVDKYTGTGTIDVSAGTNAPLSVTMNQIEDNGTISVIGENQRFIYVTLIEKNGGRLITGATLKFTQGGNEVKTVTINAEAQKVYLPVQAEFVSEISEGYTYEITHSNYLVLSGTIKVSMNEMEIDGTLYGQEYEYVNFQKMLDEDMEAPVVNSANFPVERKDSQGNFNVTANITDNRVMGAVTATVNGHTVNGTKSGDNYTFSIVQNWLNLGDNTIKISAKDTSGNETVENCIVKRTDDVLPTGAIVRLLYNGNPIQSSSLMDMGHHNYIGTTVNMTDFYQLEISVSDNHQIASVTSSVGVVQNKGGGTYWIDFPQQGPGNYTCTITIKDVAGNTKTIIYNYSIQSINIGA